MKAALIGPELEENLALRYIHASVVAAGHEAAIFDFHEAAQIPGLVRQIMAYAPNLVGLSMVFTARAGEYVRLAEALRERGYAGHITAGGHFASLHADRLLADVPVIDSVLHGEGEQAVPELLARLGAPRKVGGITCRNGSGELLHTPPRPSVDDLDILPFPTRPEVFHQYFGRPIANILSGRGCFANCDFCSINAWHRVIGGKRFRQRSVENLVAEMAALYHDRGVRIFNFHDDNFFLPGERQNIERFTAIRDGLRRLGAAGIAIQIKARPDTVEPRSMAILQEIGLFRVFLGVESNAVAGLRALGRGITRERNREAVNLLKEMGIHVTFNLLMFEPQCTIGDLRENIHFMQEQADVPLNFCRTEVYGGTALENRLRSAGRLEGDYFGYSYHISDPHAQLAYELFRDVFSPRNFDYDGMNLRAMALDYQLHLLRHFHRGAGGETLHRQVKGLIRELNTNNVELLGRICAWAETDAADRKTHLHAFSATLQAERIDFDAAMGPRCDALLKQMRNLALTRLKSGRKQGMRKATAAVAMFASVLNLDCRRTYSTEMAPVGAANAAPVNSGDTAPTEMVPRPAEESDPQDWVHATEMAPAPATQPVQKQDRSRPAGKPASRPASRPAPRPSGPKLSRTEAAKVAKSLAAAKIVNRLAAIGKRLDCAGWKVPVDLQISTAGRVVALKLNLPKDSPESLHDVLTREIRSWRFSGLKKGGVYHAELRLGTARTPERPITYPTEMAPRPR